MSTFLFILTVIYRYHRETRPREILSKYFIQTSSYVNIISIYLNIFKDHTAKMFRPNCTVVCNRTPIISMQLFPLAKCLLSELLVIETNELGKWQRSSHFIKSVNGSRGGCRLLEFIMQCHEGMEDVKADF